MTPRAANSVTKFWQFKRPKYVSILSAGEVSCIFSVYSPEASLFQVFPSLLLAGSEVLPVLGGDGPRSPSSGGSGLPVPGFLEQSNPEQPGQLSALHSSCQIVLQFECFKLSREVVLDDNFLLVTDNIESIQHTMTFTLRAPHPFRSEVKCHVFCATCGVLARPHEPRADPYASMSGACVIDTYLPGCGCEPPFRFCYCYTW